MNMNYTAPDCSIAVIRAPITGWIIKFEIRAGTLAAAQYSTVHYSLLTVCTADCSGEVGALAGPPRPAHLIFSQFRAANFPVLQVFLRRNAKTPHRAIQQYFNGNQRQRWQAGPTCTRIQFKFCQRKRMCLFCGCNGLPYLRFYWPYPRFSTKRVDNGLFSVLRLGVVEITWISPDVTESDVRRDAPAGPLCPAAPALPGPHNPPASQTQGPTRARAASQRWDSGTASTSTAPTQLVKQIQSQVFTKCSYKLAN